MLQVKIDLHVHSRHSPDSLITLKDLILYAKRAGLDGVAVTDHDRLDSALRIAREADLLIIPGMEITSLGGHILGLNIQEAVPRRLSVDDTVDRIHRAGGIAVACHPTAFFRGSLGKHVNSGFDAIEVINSAAFPFDYCTSSSEKLASQLRLPRVAGSDAHYGPEIGSAYTLADGELNADSIVKAICKGLCRPLGKPTPLTNRLKRALLVFFEKRVSTTDRSVLTRDASA
jgi:predicted metal-dependent phosphoesterase TrpH